MNIHVDGWTSDEIFRSMRRNCESYKKKCQEIEKLHKIIDNLTKENKELKKELGRGGVELKTWNDYILYVLRDGKQKTSKEIFNEINEINEINEMNKKPFLPEAKTPASTCSATCGTLFAKKKILKTNDSPLKYFVLLS